MQCSPRMPSMPKPRSGRSTLAPRHSSNDLGTRPHERLRQTRQARVHSDRRDRPQSYDCPYNAAVVSELAQSIRAIGLQTPLTCIVRDGQHVLVSGRNWLEALRIIGCEQAPVRIVDFDDVDAELWRLSENLHRAELTKLEYDKQVVRYAELLKAKQAGETAAQESETGLVPGGDKVRQLGVVSDGEGISRQVGAKVGRPESGNKLVARELNIPEQTVRRAYQTASLSPEAQEAALDVGLDDNRSALLEAAKVNNPKAQAAIIRGIAERKTLAAEPSTSEIGAGRSRRLIRYVTS